MSKTNADHEEHIHHAAPKRSSLLHAAGIGLERRRSSIPQYRIEGNQVIMHDPSGEESRYEIVHSEEKMGGFRSSIPILPFPLAIFLCILNIITPGIGTLLSGIFGLCIGAGPSGTGYGRCKAFGYNILACLLQIITLPIIVGLVWSIKWGLLFVNIAVDYKKGLLTDHTVRPGGSDLA